MAAFLIAFNKINDPEVFAEYIKAAGAASIPELKLRGVMNPCEIMDGDLPYPRLILEFPDADTARGGTTHLRTRLRARSDSPPAKGSSS